METLSSLPAEIRALVWQYCLPEPRHVVISTRRRHYDTPVVFHISHESRSEARRHYTRTPAILEIEADEYDRSDRPTRNQFWVDFSNDTICVEGDWSSGMFGQVKPSSTLARVQSLAFEFCPPQNFMQLLEILTPVHRYEDSMKDLREVVLYSGPKKWFEDPHGRVQIRHPPLDNARDAARILLRLLHMLFGGHAWLDSGAGIPPPLRWQFVANEEANVWAGPFPRAVSYDYVFRCARTGKFEIQNMTWEQLGRLRRVQSPEPRVHDLVGCYENCPEHHGDATAA